MTQLLSDEEIEKAVGLVKRPSTNYFYKSYIERLMRDYRAIEAAVLAKFREQEPVAWLFQHEDTGRTMCVEAQQVEWNFEKLNPRLQKIHPLYAHPMPPKEQK